MRNALSNLLAIASVVIIGSAVIFIFVVLIMSLKTDKISVTNKETDIKTIEYGQVVVYDNSIPEVSDIIFVFDKNTNKLHYYRVTAIKIYEGLIEYSCKDDMGNEIILNNVSNYINRVLKEDSFSYFVEKHSGTLLLGVLFAISLALGLIGLSMKIEEPVRRYYYL